MFRARTFLLATLGCFVNGGDLTNDELEAAILEAKEERGGDVCKGNGLAILKGNWGER